MTPSKTKIKLLEERPDKVKLKFPSVEIPITVSRRYFKKIKKSEQYQIVKMEDASAA